MRFIRKRNIAVIKTGGTNYQVSEFFSRQLLNLYIYSRYYDKRVKSGGAHFRGLAPEQHSSETSQRWQDCIQFVGPGTQTKDLSRLSNAFNHHAFYCKNKSQ